MAGFASPDVPAYVCYAIIVVFGVVVAVGTINRLLEGYPDHWAFASTWGLFAAHAAVPVLLFWFLDYTGAIHDTSILAAILVALGYRQIFAGSVQGVTLPGQTAGFWKPFEAWVAAVADRIGTKQKLYLDRFDEKVRSLIFADPKRLASLETLVLSISGDVPALQTALDASPATGNPDADRRRRLDTLWRDLRTSRPRDYGWLLYKRGIVRLWRYWMWLGNGRAKLISGASIVAGLLLLTGLSTWMSGVEGGIARREAGMLRYHQWRFLKPNVTDRDQWRSQEFLAERLHAVGAGAGGAASMAASAEALLSPFLRELRFASIGDRQARSILALVVNGQRPRRRCLRRAGVDRKPADRIRGSPAPDPERPRGHSEGRLPGREGPGRPLDLGAQEGRVGGRHRRARPRLARLVGKSAETRVVQKRRRRVNRRVASRNARPHTFTSMR